MNTDQSGRRSVSSKYKNTLVNAELEFIARHGE